MKKNLTRQWVAALMVAAGLLMALPVAAQKTTKDIDEWSNNDNFGKSGATPSACPSPRRSPSLLYDHRFFFSNNPALFSNKVPLLKNNLPLLNNTWPLPK